jgi:alanyl-tRNA synthetase
MHVKTERLFEISPYSREFDANVVDLRSLPEEQGIVLDKTLFYPEGGGQPSDRGTLNGNPVTSVWEDGQAIVLATRGYFKIGDSVHGILDWARRFDHMQQHSGQHLLSQAFVRSIGADTLGFHLGSEDSTIDIGSDGLTDQDVLKVEIEANRVVFENRKLIIQEKNTDDLDSIPLRKRTELTGMVRIVEIQEYDWSLCCGTHVSRTGEIGPVKILRLEKYKGGTRVHFACGNRAMEDYRAKTILIRSISQILTSGEREIPEILGKWKDERKVTEKRIQNLLDQAMETESRELIRNSVPVGAVKWVSATFRDRNPQEIQALVRALVRDENLIAIVAVIQERVTLYFARSANLNYDVRLLMEAASKVMHARGGGNASWAQCTTGQTENVEAGIQKAMEAFQNGPQS